MGAQAYLNGASTLVAAATDMAARFDRGGRLLVSGEGRAQFDARHVAVEFVHPVIVGKRALPAVVGRARTGPDDIVMGIGYGGTTVDDGVDIALADHAVPGASFVVALPPDDPFGAKEAALVAYHVLWELVHVFLETRVRAGGGTAALDALYPMISSAAEVSESTVAEAHASTVRKLSESAALRTEALAENADRIAAAAALIAAAPTVFTFGNGGSAADAADLAHALGEKGWALSDDVATVTALANDVSFDVVYGRPLATLARPGEAVVALSTSGTSVNVLAGLAEARRRGLATIGLAGYGGGDMAAADIDVCCVVHSTSVHRIQECYVAIYDEMVRATAG